MIFSLKQERGRERGRWERPLETSYGRARREPHAEVTSEGWMLKAQDRPTWKMYEWDFARA